MMHAKVFQRARMKRCIATEKHDKERLPQNQSKVRKKEMLRLAQRD